jgi:hypothetical protein
VQPRPITVNVTHGDFTIALVPNDTCSPVTYYTVQWLPLYGGAGWTEHWYVVTCGSSLTIPQVQACPSGSGYLLCSYLAQTWAQQPQTFSSTNVPWNTFGVSVCPS